MMGNCCCLEGMRLKILRMELYNGLVNVWFFWKGVGTNFQDKESKVQTEVGGLLCFLLHHLKTEKLIRQKRGG